MEQFKHEIIAEFDHQITLQTEGFQHGLAVMAEGHQMLSEKLERIVKIHVEMLPEGFYLATSDDIQGLAQGRTVTETLEIGRDVARWLLDAQKERKGNIPSKRR